MPYRSHSTAGDAQSTTLAVPIPAGAATNDILIMSFYAEATLGLTLAFDVGTWTKIPGASGQQTGPATDFEVYRYWARWGTQTGNVTISWGGASVWNAAICTAVSGRITSGDPQDGTATFNAAGTPGTTATALGITTGHANADLLMFEDDVDGGLHSTWIGAITLTERADFGGHGSADGVITGAGATGNYTTGVGSTYWTASLIALREASGVTDVPIAIPKGTLTAHGLAPVANQYKPIYAIPAGVATLHGLAPVLAFAMANTARIVIRKA